MADDEQTFEEFVADAGQMSEDAPGATLVELVGQVFAGPTKGTFMIRMGAEQTGEMQVIEGQIKDVESHEMAFEDSAGRKTSRIRMDDKATIKIVTSSGRMVAGPARGGPGDFAVPKPFDPKPFDPKGADPKGIDPKQTDPKFDPKQFDPKQTDPKFDPKQFDPKTQDPKNFDPKQQDPKFDPKQIDPKQFDPKQLDPKTQDPKFDPKQFDPKTDPIKQLDPQGPGGINPGVINPGPGASAEPFGGQQGGMMPFVLASQMFGTKQGQ